MPNDDHNSEAELDAAHVTAAGADGAVATPAIPLADLNKLLGKDFKDVPTALKSLADTNSFVGKKLEAAAPAAPAVDAALASKVQSLEEQLFFTANPQYKGYESILKKLGSNLSEAAASDDFKSIFEKGKIADDVASSKSVLTSNPRLQQAKTVVDTAIATANARGSTVEDVAEVFAREINESAAQK